MESLISEADLRPPVEYKPLLDQYGNSKPVNEHATLALPNGSLFKPSQLGIDQFAAILNRLNWTHDDRLWFATQYTNMRAYFKGETRKGTGEPYHNHLKAVVYNLIVHGQETSPVAVISALQHDSIEDVLRLNPLTGMVGDRPDCWYSFLEFFTKIFGSEDVAKIVLAVTKPDRSIPKKLLTQTQLDEFSLQAYKKVLYLYPEIKVLAARVKVADRVSNLDTMQGYSARDIALKIRETIRYILPIAEVAGEIFVEMINKRIQKRRSCLLVLPQDLQRSAVPVAL